MPVDQRSGRQLSRPTLPTRVHVLGAGGIGLSAVAILLRQRGVSVTGSDLRESPIVDTVRRAGADIRIGPWPEAAAAAEWLVAPTGLSAHSEVEAARAAGRERLDRDQAIVRLMGDRPLVVVGGEMVRGATSFALAALLQDDDPGFAIGAVPRWGNTHANDGSGTFILEADHRQPLATGTKLAVISDMSEPATPWERALDLGPSGPWSWASADRSVAVDAKVTRRGFDLSAATVTLTSPDETQRVALELPAPPMTMRAVLAASGAAICLGVPIADLVARWTRAARSAILVGQLDSGDGRYVHDVRTYPASLRALALELASWSPSPLGLVIRPYGFTFDHAAFERVAGDQFSAVLVVPPYPGTSPDTSVAIAQSMANRGVPCWLLDKSDEGTVRPIIDTVERSQGPCRWLLSGGDDMGLLRQELEESRDGSTSL